MSGALTSARNAYTRARPFAVTILLGAAALTIALAGARAIADIVGPAFLALVLTISLHPIRIWLERHRFPELVASVVLLLAAYLVLFLLTLALIVSVAQLAELLPQYEDQLTQVVTNAGNTLTSLGVQQEQINAVVEAIDPGKLVDLAFSLLSSTLSVLGNLFFLLTLLFFMAFDTNSTRRSMAVLGSRVPDLAAAVSSFARGARNYMSVSAGFGFIVAIVDGLALQLMGVPGAFVWAVLAFVTNFIPNIGFIIGVIPPALIALLEGGPGLMIAVIATYSVINFLIQSVIQPRVVGDAVGLTALLTFISLVFWTWVIGPLGALLAVPLTLLTRALLVETNPRLRWALPLIAGKAQLPEKPEQPQKDSAGTSAELGQTTSGHTQA
jgi:AI-2 transport protein TqsA